MRRWIAAAALMLAAGSAQAEYPSNIVADGLPEIPQELKQATQPYLNIGSASFLGWNSATRGQIIATRFGKLPRLTGVTAVSVSRKASPSASEPVLHAAVSPTGSGAVIYSQDRQGDEVFQLYRLDPGIEEAAPLTNGKGRNTGTVWAKDESLIVYVSTRRNGTDTDLYAMNPRDPASDRMVRVLAGSGWQPQDVSPDRKHALVLEYISANESYLHLVNLETGEMRLITPRPKSRSDETVAYGMARYAPDGTIYVTTDKGADFSVLARLDPETGRTTPVTRERKWDVEAFAIAPDGSFIAYAVNVAGVSVLRVIDPKTRKLKDVPRVPDGVITGLEIAPWGEIGFSLTSAQVPGDAFSVDPAGMKLRRWTASSEEAPETRGFVHPEFIRIRSFDGLEISGFLYRPDPSKFPGKRPLIINIHGGPESQSRPNFLGADNYLINEMGIALFFPNVRGSEGYGKKFLKLDNGYKREAAVKDIGAFIKALAKDQGLDRRRFGVTGGSYGGYMTLAALTRYSSELRAGVDVMGISHFVTFLSTTGEYRRDLRRVEYGDERDPKMRAYLERISPLSNAHRIKVPLMVVTGANDPRVPASEAEQIVQAVRRNGGEAWHLLARDEGHGFKKKSNQDIQFWATIMFWKKHLLE